MVELELLGDTGGLTGLVPATVDVGVEVDVEVGAGVEVDVEVGAGVEADVEVGEADAVAACTLAEPLPQPVTRAEKDVRAASSTGTTRERFMNQQYGSACASRIGKTLDIFGELTLPR